MPKTARGPKTDEDLKSTNESKNTDTEQQQPNIPEKLQDLPKHKLKNTTASTKHPQYWNVSLNRLHHQGRGSSTDHKKASYSLDNRPISKNQRQVNFSCQKFESVARSKSINEPEQKPKRTMSTQLHWMSEYKRPRRGKEIERSISAPR